MMKPRRVPGCLIALFALAGCVTDPASPPIVPVASVAIAGAPTDGVFLLGFGRQLGATILDPGSLPLDGRRTTWRSSKPSVATVSPEGLVEGLAVGTTAITLGSEGITSSIAAEVREGLLVPSAGAPATATLLGGLVSLSVPPGVMVAGSPIHVRAAPSVPPDDRTVAGTAVALGPLETELAAPIVPAILFDPNGIPAVERPTLRLFAIGAEGQWQELPGGSVDLAESRVSADLSRLTTVAVFRRSTPTQITKAAGDEQVVPRGTAVPIAPTVLIRDASDRPVSGIQVTFATGPEGGQLTGQSTSLSGLDGLAAVSGQWRMGSSAGTYTLTATIAGGLQVTFTATATP